MKLIRVLIADEDQGNLIRIKSLLSKEGMEIVGMSDGMSVLNQFRKWPADLVIINIDLPNLNGLEICRRIKRVSSKLVILLVEKGNIKQIESGFEAGADDCIEKDIHLSRLEFSVKTLLRNRVERQKPTSHELAFNNIVLDMKSRRVILQGKTIDVTPLEYRLLQYLITNPGKVLSKEKLIENVWGYTLKHLNEALYYNLVEAAISRLRKKIEVDASHPQYLKTVWGLGYRFGE